MPFSTPGPSSKLPHVLFDIDGTLTDDAGPPQIDSRYVMGNALFEIFTDHLVKKGMDRAEASRKLHEYAEEKLFWDYDDFVNKFNLPEPGIWNDLRHWHHQHLHIYADGVALVRRLYDQGFPLHIVSNNPRLGCLLKLEAAGLGTLEGSRYFSSIFCSNHQCGQKSSLGFWKRILNASGLDPGETVIVGNNPHEDHEVPAQLNFRGSYLVDREGIYSPGTGGAVFVNTLLDVDLEPIYPETPSKTLAGHC